ncbi:MAG TPA: hypothetical protein VMO26_22105 [Vicinamibacterales bacterium]|nr:hypothetical protein [Vicinamibacterales bacterium]
MTITSDVRHPVQMRESMTQRNRSVLTSRNRAGTMCAQLRLNRENFAWIRHSESGRCHDAVILPRRHGTIDRIDMGCSLRDNSRVRKALDACGEFKEDRVAETVTRDLRVNWITSRIEFTNNTNDLERFFFEASDGNQFYIDLNKANVASEMAAISLIRDAFLHGKRLNLWWEERNNRRWLKAVNLHN